MEIDIENIDRTGGYNPYQLAWGEEIMFPSTRKLTEYGNRVYNRYPARSIFLVPRAILSQYKNKGINVLDPFMGSGTTAVETIISGNTPIGVEMDPFARLIADVSSTIFSEKDFSSLKEVLVEIVRRWNTFEPASTPKLAGIERWFKNDDLKKLLSLKNCIKAMTPSKYLSFMMVAYADCIKPVSLMERQSLKPYISQKHPKVTKEVIDSFVYSYNVHIEAMKQMTEVAEPSNIEWIGEDATNFRTESPYIDLAISSPPYINALDYTRCVKIEGAMCDCIDNEIAADMRNVQVGHENRKNEDINDIVYNTFKPWYDKILPKDKGRANTCMAYFNDIYKNLICVYQALKPNGEYHIIIGDNTIKTIEVPTHKIIASLAEYVGYKWFGYYKYKIKDHRTSIPRDNVKNKIQLEYVLMLKK